MLDKWSRALRARRVVALPLLFALGAAGCGNLTAGGFGEVTVAVVGDRPESVGVAPSPALTPPLLTSHTIEGSVEADFMLFLVTESGSALRLGDELIEVRLDVRGASELEPVDRQLVTATRYTELQVVFTDIRAEVEGLVVDGIPIPEVRVELDDVSLLVTRAIDLDVSPGQSVRLLIDLNALSWLEAVDPISGTVDEAVFAALIDVVSG